MDNTIRKIIKTFLPKRIFNIFRPYYHYALALASATYYRFPARHITVIGVTGTKGKTTTVELINAIFERAGHKTALTSSLRFKIGADTQKNEYKMSMPGRFFLQRFLRRAVTAKCRYAVIEMTSEGATQYRHKFLNINSLVFTNLSMEHIESHGSFEAYRSAKLSIFKELEKSKSKNKFAVINKDDGNAPFFMNARIKRKVTFSLQDIESYTIKKDGIIFTIDGRQIDTNLSGLFNLYNILGAIALAKAYGIKIDIITSAIRAFKGVEGRMEYIDEGQDFTVVVDYAHTPDSLEKVYEFFQLPKKICVLGSCGGGRDKWKRAEFGKIAAKHCDQVVLTNEDPYDEDPRAIIDSVAEYVPDDKKVIIEDRAEAIAEAIRRAKTGDAVIITGKGAEPWLMGPNGQKISWDDRAIARTELRKLIR